MQGSSAFSSFSNSQFRRLSTSYLPKIRLLYYFENFSNSVLTQGAVSGVRSEVEKL